VITEVYSIPIRLIRGNPLNPKGRTQGRKQNLLVEEIRRAGKIHEPIHVIKTKIGFIVTRGHRRLAAYKELGISEIPAIIVDDDLENIEAYLDQQINVQHDGYQIAELYVGNPNTIRKGPNKNALAWFERTFGKPELSLLVKNYRLSPRGIKSAKKLFSWLTGGGEPEADKEFFSRLLMFMLEHSLERQLSALHKSWKRSTRSVKLPTIMQAIDDDNAGLVSQAYRD